MLTNEDKLMIENIITMINRSPWNKDNQVNLKDVLDMCLKEDMYVVLEMLREEDTQRQQNYQK